MPSGTMQYTGELTVVTCWCGMPHAVPTELHEYQQRQHRNGVPERDMQSIYCPLGHVHIPAGEGKAIRLQRELDDAQLKLIATRDQLAAAEREAKRIAKRTASGVCPCCNRSFVQLARHMKSQHPEHAT